MKVDNIVVKNMNFLTFEALSGDRFFTVLKSGWKDRYIVVSEDAVEEYDPIVQCLTAEQILEAYEFDINENFSMEKI